MTLRQAFILEGEQRGLEKGLMEGRLATIREVISKLKSKGLKKDEIACLTDIEPGEIDKILKESEDTH